MDYASIIDATLELHGAWFFQVKADAAGVLNLMEIAPRIGGASTLSRAHGVNLPLLSLYEAERIPVSVQPVAPWVELDRALINRYKRALTYRTLYLDFDDTLVVRGRVNPDMAKLLYQAVNVGVRLILLTRHAGDLDQVLTKHRLKHLFDEVIHIRNGEPKAAFILDRDSIMIDDSFTERTTVHQQLGIPVFDSSMIEMLFDDRI